MGILQDVQREQDIYELAVDIARQIFPIPNLLLKYKITEQELEELYSNLVFKEIIKQATSEWNAAGNTHKRTKLKAAIITETVLPSLVDAMTNNRETLGDRVKALDTVAKIAGLNSSEGSGGPIGSTFRLSINFAPNTAAIDNITLGVTSEPENAEQDISDQSETPAIEELELLPIASRFAGVPPEDI